MSPFPTPRDGDASPLGSTENKRGKTSVAVSITLVTHQSCGPRAPRPALAYREILLAARRARLREPYDEMPVLKTVGRFLRGDSEQGS